MLERYFKSSTKENDQEYSIEVTRKDDFFVANVFGKFRDLPEIKRTATFQGLNAEQKVQDWLVELDKEVRGLVDKDRIAQPTDEAKGETLDAGTH